VFNLLIVSAPALIAHRQLQPVLAGGESPVSDQR
jgi:hypothetical protein